MTRRWASQTRNAFWRNTSIIKDLIIYISYPAYLLSAKSDCNALLQRNAQSDKQVFFVSLLINNTVLGRHQIALVFSLLGSSIICFDRNYFTKNFYLVFH